MPEEDSPSLLGGLAEDLALGLVVDPGNEPDWAQPGGVANPPPLSAILEPRGARGEEGPEARERAAAILTAAGLVARSLQWSLEVTDGVMEVGESALVVGRLPRPDVAIVVPDMLVSRVHCRFAGVAGGLAVEDLGSTNGLAVRRGDGRIDVEPGTHLTLAHGDVVTVSDEIVIATVHARDVST